MAIEQAELAEQDAEVHALNELMKLLRTTPDNSKPTDFPVLLPAYNFPEEREKLVGLVSTGKFKETLGTQVTHETVKRHSDKDVEKYFKR